MTNSQHYQQQLAQERFALRVAARLSDASEDLGWDVSERLRAARVQAVGQRKTEAVRTASVWSRAGAGAALTWGGDAPDLWDRITALVPLLVLIAGLFAINVIQNEQRANELAEVDAALLTDDLPPSAYTDPGFVQFLKATGTAGTTDHP